MIPIENEKRIDWNAIRAEYIGGGISQRKLADKYSIPVDMLLRRANRERWAEDREKANNKAAIKAQQKTAEAAADNAVISADLKKRLLLRLARIEAKYPYDATEVKTKDGKNQVTFRIRDLTAAYKDLTEDMPKVEGNKNAPIFELLRKLDGECDV